MALFPLFKNKVIGKGKIMENSKLVALQAKRDALKKAVKDKQKEMDCFDVLDYYDEEMFLDEMRVEYGTVDIMGCEYNTIDALHELDRIAFREKYNNHLDTLDKGEFEEYKELEEELEELENELMEIEEELEQLENE